jgi:hypothetical protein
MSYIMKLWLLSSHSGTRSSVLADMWTDLLVPGLITQYMSGMLLMQSLWNRLHKTHPAPTPAPANGEEGALNPPHADSTAHPTRPLLLVVSIPVHSLASIAIIDLVQEGYG